MRTIILTVAALLFVLFVLTFVAYPPSIADAYHAGFSMEEIDTGLQFAFERRLFFWGSTAVELALLFALGLTRVGRRLADRWLAWCNNRIVAALGVGLTFFMISEVLYLPIGIARMYHAQAWGLYNLDLAEWARDHAISFGISLVWEGIVLAGFYALLIALPRMWWLVAPFGLGGLAILYATLAPILINPLYNTFTPLGETEWKSEQPRVRALIDKAGAPVEDILVMNASRQSFHGNAYFTGFGPTRRIVLFDNLFKNHTPDEIDSILAHELGHWQYDHINKGIFLGALGALLGCYVLHRILVGVQGRAPWNLRSSADPAGLPLILLLIYLGSWVEMPIGNTITRYFERQADQVSLELAGKPEAFIECEKRLARTNKANVAPAPWSVWLFSSHPSTVERIRTASEWKRE